MRRCRVIAGLMVIIGMMAVQSFAGQFVVFPKAGELVSPDGRFIVRNSERAQAAGEFVGTFRSLWLLEVATGRSRKLCDYVGVAAVGWSGADFVVVTQYLSKRTSRALVFPVSGLEEPVLLDQPALIRMVPPELRETLRKNDHVFVEASRVEGQTLYLRVWGYGQHDASGFRWGCEYALQEGSISCKESGSR
jgi:hypothetical protein